MRFLVLLFFLVALGPFARQFLRAFYRKKKYTHILSVLQDLYQDINPYEISKNASLRAKDNSPDLLYGEIDPCALLDMLDIIKPAPKDIFYDLGSGAGKSALAVKMRYPELEVLGFEIIEELHQVSMNKRDQFLHQYGQKIDPSELEFIHANILDHHFCQADIIFINAVAYSAGTWRQILYKFLQAKSGVKIIVTSKTLPTPAFHKLYQGMELMSWGRNSTYIYEKVI
jgi:hypothetical protein